MSEEPFIEDGTCAHCGYSLAGLQSTICPECGKEQPPPVSERRVRADRVWLGLSLLGIAVFAGLAWFTLKLDTVLGGIYTGVLSMVRAVVGFGAASAIYAIAAFEIRVHRSKFRGVRPLTATRGIATLLLFGIAAFMGVLLSHYL